MNTKCLRCGAPNATRYSPFWDRGNVCVECEKRILGMLKLAEKYPANIRVDVIGERFATRIAANSMACSDCGEPLLIGQESELCLRCHAERLGIDEYEMEEV